MNDKPNHGVEDAIDESMIAACGLRPVRAYICEARVRSKLAQANSIRQAKHRQKKAEEVQQMRTQLAQLLASAKPSSPPAPVTRSISQIPNQAERLGRKILPMKGWRRRLVLFLLP